MMKVKKLLNALLKKSEVIIEGKTSSTYTLAALTIRKVVGVC